MCQKDIRAKERCSHWPNLGQQSDKINDYNPVMDYNTETKANIHEFRKSIDIKG